ncbi:MAG: 30S ribosomal protein S3ae [Thermoplasmatota archaeon]
MALARSRAAARRVKDKWKAKNWYRVTAPTAFNSHLLAETLADDPEKLPGRTVEVTMQELTGDFKQMHVKLGFRIHEINGLEAKTQFIGHSMTSDYVRRLTRRGHSKVSAVFDVRTKDGSRLRVKPFAVTDRRSQTTQLHAIRGIMKDTLESAAAELSMTGLMAQILNGDLANAMFKEARKIHPLRRIEIAKTELLAAPAVEMDETPVITFPEPEPEPSEDDEAAAEGDAETSDESEGDVDEVVADDAEAEAEASGDEEE